MTGIRRAARQVHWLVAAFALALVCVPGRDSRADEKSDLVGRVEDKLEDAADALERLPDDSNDGAIDRARSLVGEARRHADDLGRIADDSDSKRVAENFDDYQDDFDDAAGNLRQLKNGQRASEPVATACAERDKELTRLANDFESRNDPDGLTELPREAAKAQEMVKRQLDELARQDDRMEDWSDDAQDFDADGPWRDLSSAVDQVARAVYDRWRRGHEDTRKACEQVAKGVEHPEVKDALSKLGSSAGGRKQIIEQLNSNARELWSVLSRVSEDSGMGSLERAKSLLQEIERGVESLGRTPTTDKEAKVIVEKWPEGIRQLEAALEALEHLKQHQHDLDELPARCEARKRELREAIEKNGDDTDGIQEIPALAEKLAEPVRPGLEKARERGREEERDRDKADDVSVTEGAWSAGPSTMQREAEETYRTFADNLKKTEEACADVVKGSNAPQVNAELADLKSRVASTGDQLDRDVATWVEQARSAYIVDCKAMEELWQAYCGVDWEPDDDAPEDIADQTGHAIQDRMQATMTPLLTQLKELKPRVQAIAKKRETKSRGESLLAMIEKEEPRLKRLMNQETWRGNNHPLIQYSRRYGEDRHKAEWSSMGCQVPISATSFAVFPGGKHQKPDCIIAKSGQCEVWEFKPKSKTGEDEGKAQIDDYKNSVPRYYTEKHRKNEAPDSTKGGMDFLKDLRKYCLDKEDDEIVFSKFEVKHYDMCEKQYVCEQ